MIKRKIPFAHAKSIYDVDLSFFKKHGIKVVLTDLDNTLAPIYQKDADEKVFDLVKRYKEAGLRLIIVSNNTGKRVKRFSAELGIENACWMLKPLSLRLKKFLKKQKIDKSEVILVGDQILTDIMAGNGAKIKTLLTEPLVPEDPIWTRWNRFFEKPTRKKLLAKHIVKEWEETL